MPQPAASPAPDWSWSVALLLTGLAALVAGTILAVLGVLVAGTVLVGVVVLDAAFALLSAGALLRLLRGGPA